MMPVVSVIIPAYNCELYLRHAVESALNQTFAELEVLVLDDCSTDRTLALAHQLAQSDNRVKVFSNPQNIGVAETRNRGIQLSKGEYIAFLDGDDIWMPEKLAKQLVRVQQTSSILCYASYSFIDSMGKPVGQPYMVPQTTTYRKLLCENTIGCSTVLLKKEALNSLRFNSIYFHEDYALWLALLRGGGTSCGLTEVLTYYRTGGRSSNKWKSAKNRWIIYRQGEKMTFLKSLMYLGVYFFKGVKKHRAIT